MSPGNTPISSTTEACQVCGIKETICQHLGVVRFEVPVDDPRFGKLFHCPNNHAALDTERQAKLRKLSNLEAFANKSFANFNAKLPGLTSSESQSLEIAVRLSKSFAEEPRGWLLLEGAFGCGKTHLAAAVGNARLAKGDYVIFITAPDLLDHLRSAYGPSSEMGYDETFERIRAAQLLILDDLGVENPSPWAQEKLFQLLNYRYSHELPTIITTNTDVDRLDPRIRSRILHTDLTRRLRITAPDYRTAMENEIVQLTSSLQLYSSMTFENFVLDRSLLPKERENLERAYEVAFDYAMNGTGWLVLTGTYGSGKTHLAAAIAHHRTDDAGKKNVAFITVPDLLDYLRITYDPSASVSFDQRFQMVRKAEFLVLDDLGTENATSWAKEKLFQILDFRYVAQLPTVITTSKPIEELDGRIAVRLQDDRRCKIFALTASSYAVRRKRK